MNYGGIRDMGMKLVRCKMAPQIHSGGAQYRANEAGMMH